MLPLLVVIWVPSWHYGLSLWFAIACFWVLRNRSIIHAHPFRFLVVDMIGDIGIVLIFPDHEVSTIDLD